MAEYQEVDGGGVRRACDGANIPPDAGNSDWQEYQRWLAAGNAPDPRPAPPAEVPAVDPSKLADELVAAGTLTQEAVDRARAGGGR
ncbi:MAG: hypothetical protein RIE31_05145 [Alphaproteobacteria bacterium]